MLSLQKSERLQAQLQAVALQLHRMMHQSAGSEYRTFWYMCHRLRAAMKNMEWDSRMAEVEVDETYVGGKDKNRHAWKKTHKTGGEASGKVRFSAIS